MPVTKRAGNDRNAQAVKKAQAAAENLDQLVLKDGTVIQLQDIDPIFVQMAIQSVKNPKRPTYEVTLASGRTEHYPMDELVAEQSPELKPLWDRYLMEQAAAQGEIMKRMTRAIILDGTVMPEQWYDPAWERRMRIIGIDLPDDPEERWVLYIEAKMSTEESVALTSKIMRRTGVPEEFIAAAEDTFRGEVPGGQGRPGDVADLDGSARDSAA